MTTDSTRGVGLAHPTVVPANADADETAQCPSCGRRLADEAADPRTD